MAKPIVVATREGPEWRVIYTDNESNERFPMSVYGSPTIEDALREARLSLEATKNDWYTITRIEWVDPIDEPIIEDEP